MPRNLGGRLPRQTWTRLAPRQGPVFTEAGELHSDRGGSGMRQDVEFQAEGPRLRGWLYTPDAGGRPFPTVVMAHGFSAVKEMYLDRFAEAFAEVGLAALVFDNRSEERRVGNEC